MAKICKSIFSEKSTESIITQLPPKEIESWTQVSIVLKVILISSKVGTLHPWEEHVAHQFSSISFDLLKSYSENLSFFFQLPSYKMAGNINHWVCYFLIACYPFLWLIKGKLPTKVLRILQTRAVFIALLAGASTPASSEEFCFHI